MLTVLQGRLVTTNSGVPYNDGCAVICLLYSGLGPLHALVLLLAFLRPLHLVQTRHRKLYISYHDRHHLRIVQRSHQCLLYSRTLPTPCEHINGLLRSFPCVVYERCTGHDLAMKRSLRSDTALHSNSMRY